MYKIHFMGRIMCQSDSKVDIGTVVALMINSLPDVKDASLPWVASPEGHDITVECVGAAMVLC